MPPRGQKEKPYQMDGFANINKDIGTSKDWQNKTVYARNRYIDQKTAETLYTTNWMASRVSDVPIKDATREWREMFIEDSEKLKEWEKLEAKLKLVKNFERAESWGRVYGGSAIIIVTNDGDLSTPLNLNAINENTSIRLITLDRYHIIADEPNRNVLDENYGLPDFYTVTEAGQRIHYSRVIRFEGESATIEEAMRNNYWGSSAYERLYDPIQNSQTSTQLISGLIYESNIDVYKIKGLNEAVIAKNDELAKKRITLAHQLKSIVNGIALDAEDDYDSKSKQFGGLAEIDDRMMLKVAAASGIPYTKLVGKSAEGLSATGEGDLKNYYDMVRSEIQEGSFREKLEYIDAIMARKLGIDKPEFDFKPLYQMSDKEKAEVEKTRADTDAVYIDRGIVGEDEVLGRLAKYDTYPGVDERIRLIEKQNED